MNKFFLSILVAFFLLIKIHSAAQEKCQLEVNQVDPITNMVVKRTIDYSIGKLFGQPLYFKAQCIGEKKYLKMRYFLYGNVEISDEEPIRLIFLDDSFLEIKPRKMPQRNSEGSLTTVSAMLIYDLDNNQARQLTSNRVKKIELRATNGESFEVEVRERFREYFIQMVQCVTL